MDNIGGKCLDVGSVLDGRQEIQRHLDDMSETNPLICDRLRKVIDELLEGGFMEASQIFCQFLGRKPAALLICLSEKLEGFGGKVARVEIQDDEAAVVSTRVKTLIGGFLADASKPIVGTGVGEDGK